MYPEPLPEDEDFRQVRNIYLASTAKMTRQIDEALERCEQDGNRQDLSLVCRLSHSIRGSSYQLGFSEIGHVAEAMERLSQTRLGAGRLTPEDSRALREGARFLADQVRKLSRDESLDDPSELCLRLRDRTP